MPENIREILGSVKKDRWVKKLSKIKIGMDEYEREDARSSSATNDEIIKQYLNPILPTYWEVFHTHNISRRMTGALPCRENDYNHLPYYNVGIFLVGFSSLPITLSLAEIQPREQIYFLYSKDTKDTLYEIGDRIDTMLNNSNPQLVNLVTGTILNHLGSAALEIDNPSDPVATFKRIKEIINKVGNKRIALDLTGGKKTMIGGGFTAGAILNFANSIRSSACDMFYIDSLEYDPGRGSPKTGTEFLSLLENPYDVYNVQAVQEAKKLFEQHNYEEAANLWEGVKDKLESRATRYGLETEKEETIKSHRRANCYHLWDAFYYDKAKNGKKRHGDSWGYNEKHTHNKIDVLDILSMVRDRNTLFHEEKKVIHYAVDRYQNAIRRKESGKLDDAIVRFTQVIEMLCAYKIYRIAQDGDLVNESNSESVPPDKEWELRPLIRLLFGKQAVRLNGGYYSVLEDQQLELDVYDYQNIDGITDLIKYRNGFIHFNSPMKQKRTEENTRKLQKLALRFLANFSKDYRRKQCLSFKNLLKLHRFQKE